METKPQQTAFSHRKRKGSKRSIQLELVQEGFFQTPMTMLMLAKKINLERASICWLCKALREHDKIVAIKKDKCAITRHWANYWTTNPDLFPAQPQLKLAF